MAGLWVADVKRRVDERVELTANENTFGDA